MREGAIIVIIGLILVAICTVVILRTTILRYKLGDRGYKAALTIVILVVALFCAALVVGTGYDIRAISFQLMDSRVMDPRWVARLKEDLVYKRNTVYIVSVIGYLLLGMYYFLYKSIQKVTKSQQAQAIKNRWDWSKVSK